MALAIGSAIGTAGSIASGIGSLFGGGGPPKVRLPSIGKDGRDGNPLSLSSWRQTWAQAPAGVKDAAWRAALNVGQGVIVVDAGPNASDVQRMEAIFWGANGGSDGDHDALDNRMLEIARNVERAVGTPAAPQLGIPVTQAPVTTTAPQPSRTAGQTIDDIIAAIEGRPRDEVVPQSAAEAQPVTAAGIDPMTLLIAGGAAFLIARAL